MLRSILAAVIAGTEPDLKINSEAQSYLQAELALNQAGGQGGGQAQGMFMHSHHPWRAWLPLALSHIPGAVALIIISAYG